MKSVVPNLAKLVHTKVMVNMCNKHVFEGMLVGYDAFMNLVLTDVTRPENAKSVVIRGECVENVVSIDTADS